MRSVAGLHTPNQTIIQIQLIHHSARRQLRSPKSGKRRLEQRLTSFYGCGQETKRTQEKQGMPDSFGVSLATFVPIPRYSDFFHDAFRGLGIFVPIPGSPHRALGSVALRPSPRPVHCGRLAVDLSWELSGSAFRSF